MSREKHSIANKSYERFHSKWIAHEAQPRLSGRCGYRKMPDGTWEYNFLPDSKISAYSNELHKKGVARLAPWNPKKHKQKHARFMAYLRRQVREEAELDRDVDTGEPEPAPKFEPDPKLWRELEFYFRIGPKPNPKKLSRDQMRTWNSVHRALDGRGYRLYLYWRHNKTTGETAALTIDDSAEVEGRRILSYYYGHITWDEYTKWRENPPETDAEQTRWKFVLNWFQNECRKKLRTEFLRYLENRDRLNTPGRPKKPKDSSLYYLVERENFFWWHNDRPFGGYVPGKNASGDTVFRRRQEPHDLRAEVLLQNPTSGITWSTFGKIRIESNLRHIYGDYPKRPPERVRDRIMDWLPAVSLDDTALPDDQTEEIDWVRPGAALKRVSRTTGVEMTWLTDDPDANNYTGPREAPEAPARPLSAPGRKHTTVTELADGACVDSRKLRVVLKKYLPGLIRNDRIPREWLQSEPGKQFLADVSTLPKRRRNKKGRIYV